MSKFVKQVNSTKAGRNVLSVQKPSETKRFGGVNVCYDKA